MSDIGDQIRKHRLESGLSIRALAQKANVPHSSISDLETGRVKKSRYLAEIAGALGLSIEHVSGSQVRLIDNGDVRTGDEFGLVLPVLTDSDLRRFLGEDGKVEFPDEEIGKHEMMRGLFEDMSGFWLRNITDAMEPNFMAGHDLLVDTGIHWESHDAVVALVAGDEGFSFRRILQQGGRTFLVADNKQWPLGPMEVRIVDEYRELKASTDNEVRPAMILGVVFKACYNDPKKALNRAQRVDGE